MDLNNMIYNIFICVNYNSSQETVACSESFIKLNEYNFVIIVDNASNSENKDILFNYAKNNKNIYLINSVSNIGYFSGLNLGLSFVYKNNLNFNFIIVGNNDLFFDSSFDTRLITSDIANEFPVISPSIINSDGSNSNPHVINDLSKRRKLFLKIYYQNYNLSRLINFIYKKLNSPFKRLDSNSNCSRPIIQGHGSCYVLTPLFIREIKFLPVETFLYGEEYFLSQAISSKGYVTYFISDLMVKHVGHMSVSKCNSKKIWEYQKIALHKEELSKLTRKPSFKQCRYCVMDDTDSKINFNSVGICDHCNKYFNSINPIWRERINVSFDKFKSEILKKSTSDYDCIIGVSGGVDSSYLLVVAKTILGLNPLAYHVDTGWNSDISTTNINNLVDKLKVDLYTDVINWDEMKDLQLSFIKASISNIDTPQDHAIFASLYKYAETNGIKFILTGGNQSTECIRNPVEWMYYQSDITLLKDIHNRFGKAKLTTFPLTSILYHKIYLPYIKGIKTIRPLDYIIYNKKDAINLLKEYYGWIEYPQKHFESRFTRFYESYWLPTKFGFDTRKVQYSSLILTQQLTRKEAFSLLSKAPYDESTISHDFEFVATKLGISPEELHAYLIAPNKTYKDYSSQSLLYFFGAFVSKYFSIEIGGKR